LDAIECRHLFKPLASSKNTIPAPILMPLFNIDG
jgi:hypothetical protein